MRLSWSNKVSIFPKFAFLQNSPFVYLVSVLLLNCGEGKVKQRWDFVLKLTTTSEDTLLICLTHVAEASH